MVYTYKGYETIDGFWDRYHLELQDVYDRFAIGSITVADDIQVNYGFSGKRVLDIGAGTGKAAFRIAEYADSVVSIEPFTAMRSYAIEKQKQLGIKNVQIIKGIGEDLSQFQDNEFDCAVSVAAIPIPWEDLERRKRDCASIVEGCLRVIKPGGYIAITGPTPGWKWDHLVGGMNSFPDPNLKGQTDEMLEPHGFTHRDIRYIVDYGTVEEALATHGFIYGPKAIDYILDKKVSKFSWSTRIFHRIV